MSGVGSLGAVFIADTSVWLRSDKPTVGTILSAAIERDEIATCAMVEVERLYGARNRADFRAMEQRFAALREVPVTRSVMSAAKGAMRDLAAAGPSGYHRVKPPDAIIAAAAAEQGFGVLHYDRDYDRLAEVLGFESRWVVRAGSVT